MLSYPQADRRKFARGDHLARIRVPERLQFPCADRGIGLESLHQPVAEFAERRIPTVFEFAEPLLDVVCLLVGGR